MKLDSLTALNDKISIYLPSEYKQQVIDTSKLLADMFGGSTINNVSGSWIMENKSLCSESIDIIYAYCDKLTDDIIDNIISYAETLKTDCNQESILIEVNNRGYLI